MKPLHKPKRRDLEELLSWRAGGGLGESGHAQSEPGSSVLLPMYLDHTSVSKLSSTNLVSKMFLGVL